MTLANPNWSQQAGTLVDQTVQVGLPAPPMPFPNVHGVAWETPQPVPDHPIGVPVRPNVWELRDTIRPYDHEPPNLGAHGVILAPDYTHNIGLQEPWLPYHKSFVRVQPPADWTISGAEYASRAGAE